MGMRKSENTGSLTVTFKNGATITAPNVTTAFAMFYRQFGATPAIMVSVKAAVPATV